MFLYEPVKFYYSICNSSSNALKNRSAIINLQNEQNCIAPLETMSQNKMQWIRCPEILIDTKSLSPDRNRL